MEITDLNGRVRCALIGGTPVEPVLQLISGLPDAAQDDVDIALIIHTLLDRAQLNSADAAPILQKSQHESLAALRRAEALLLVTPTARTRAWRQPWFRFSDQARVVLRTRLNYLTTSSEEAEARVVEFLLRNDTIGNIDVCELLDVGATQGSRVLRQLRERHVIALGSANATRRGVFYVRGARFYDSMQHQPSHPTNPGSRSPEEGRRLPPGEG